MTTRWAPTRTAPSGTYGFLLKEPEGGRPFIHVVQQGGGGWFPTPASWRVEDLAGHSTPEPFIAYQGGVEDSRTEELLAEFPTEEAADADACRRNAALVTPLAIDHGAAWSLSAEDTLALVLYAREIEETADPEAARVECPRGCGHERITGSGANSGFAGEGVWWTDLACGHQLVETGDPLPYIR